MVVKRLTIFVINIFFPPLGILLLCGPETDLIINCVLFLLAIIPSHVHAFYISCTYFNRKGKVRKGIYPGDWRSGIYSPKVQNGGASAREVERLRGGRGGGRRRGGGRGTTRRGADDDEQRDWEEEKFIQQEDVARKTKRSVSRRGEALVDNGDRRNRNRSSRPRSVSRSMREGGTAY